MGAVACWRRRRSPAVVLAGLGQATHPAVRPPDGRGSRRCWWWRWEPDRRRLLRYYAALLALISAAAVFASPVFGDSDPVVVATSFFGTLGVRILVLAIPIVLVFVQRRQQSTAAPSSVITHFPAVACALFLISNIAFVGPLEAEYSWGALNRKPDTQLLTFIKSDEFHRRDLPHPARRHDGKIGMYQLVQHDARLDSEFFPESIARNNWPDVTRYSLFLRKRRVDYVIIFRTYDREWRTNEHELLRGLNKHGLDGCDAKARRRRGDQGNESLRRLRGPAGLLTRGPCGRQARRESPTLADALGAVREDPRTPGSDPGSTSAERSFPWLCTASSSRT